MGRCTYHIYAYRMKLLITTQVIDINDPILGFFHGWVLEFAKHFDELHIICLRKGVYDFPSHVTVYSLGKEEGENRLKYTFRFYRFFAHIFLTVRVQYVFFHMGALYNILAAPFFLVRNFFGTKFYWWKAHGYINYVGKIALYFVDRVYTSTESGFPIQSRKRHIVGQAINVSKFVQAPSIKRYNEIIFIGRIVPIKKLEDFIDTAKILYDAGYTGVCSIIGPVDDIRYTDTLKERIKKYNLLGKVQIIPPKTGQELVDWYSHASVFLNTSRTESMDKTVLEAMLCGCIPVTANRAFIDLLSHDRLYLKDATASMYAARIQELLAHEDHESLRRRLRDDVVCKHSLHTFSQRIFTDHL